MVTLPSHLAPLVPLLASYERHYRTRKTRTTPRVDVHALAPLRALDGESTAFCTTVAQCLASAGYKEAHEALFAYLYKELFGKPLSAARIHAAAKNIIRVVSLDEGLRLPPDPPNGSLPNVSSSPPVRKVAPAVTRAWVNLDNLDLTVTERMGLDNAAALLDNLARDSDPFAFIYELLRNSFQVGSTLVRFTLDGPLLDKTYAEGDPRYCVAALDNGPGMTKTQLRNLNKLSSSGKEMGPLSARGVGARLSTLRTGFNDEVRYISFHRDEPGHGWMTILRRDPDSGVVGTVSVDFEDSNGEITTDNVFPVPEEYRTWFATETEQDPKGDLHGVLVLLRGSKETPNSFLGPRGEGGVHLYPSGANRRFFEVGDREVRGYELGSIYPTDWPRNYEEASRTTRTHTDRATYGSNRKVRGYAALLNHTCRDKGVVTLSDGTKVHWWTHPDVIDENYNPKGKRATYWRRLMDLHSLGVLASQNAAEIGVVFREEEGGFAEVYDYVSPEVISMVYLRFGISNKARRYISLFIEPVKAKFGENERLVGSGVVPSTSRRHLLYLDETTGDEAADFPWETWGREFKADLPKPIADLVRENAIVGLDHASIEAEIAALLAQDQELYKVIRISNPIGPRGKRSEAAAKNTEPRVRPGPDDGDDNSGEAKPPTPRQYAVFVEDEVSPRHVAQLDTLGNMPVVNVYMTHPFFQQVEQRIRQRLRQWDDTIAEKVRCSLRVRVGLAAAHYYLSTKSAMTQKQITKDGQNAAFEPCALSMAIRAATMIQRPQIEKAVQYVGFID